MRTKIRYMSKWFVAYNNFRYLKIMLYLLPHLDLWYHKYDFLETGVYSPSFGIKIGWLKWEYVFGLQKGY